MFVGDWSRNNCGYKIYINGSNTDEGVLTVTHSNIIDCVETIGVCSENVDSSNSGSIKIKLNINPERDTIAGYNIIFIIVLFGISIMIIRKGKNRCRIT